jgi:hypothetical protein
MKQRLYGRSRPEPVHNAQNWCDPVNGYNVRGPSVSQADEITLAFAPVNGPPTNASAADPSTADSTPTLNQSFNTQRKPVPVLQPQGDFGARPTTSQPGRDEPEPGMDSEEARADVSATTECDVTDVNVREIDINPVFKRGG